MHTVQLPSAGSRSGRGPGTISYPLLDDLPSLVWAATMAALELHTPQWTSVPTGNGSCPIGLCSIDLDSRSRVKIEHEPIR
ncbi:hypothetical protein [Amycolatopsis sp. DSM 110486]|uniref:hypothetical protein n=1 Tax=Amycolatopsis sp. DSM 110486 TaxID=2865832 RepID=UPI00351D6144